MSKDELDKLFGTIDAMDAAAFAEFLTDDAVFRYGSGDPVKGREAVREYVAGFFGGIKGLRHEIEETWSGDGSQVVQGEVTYTRHDGRVVVVPFVNVFRFDGGRIKEYLIHADPGPLFAGE